MERGGNFDYILLETTGLADPGNIAPVFWLDDSLGSTIYLDGVVTLVDAKNILKSLDEPPAEEVAQPSIPSMSEAPKHDHKGPTMTTAHLQISHADVIVINKADLVTSAELQAVEDRVGSINGLAKIHITDHSKVPQLEGVLLDLHAYDGAGEIDFAAKGHSHLDPTISTIRLSFPVLSEKQVDSVDAWLRAVCWNAQLPHSQIASSFEIHRIKGQIPTTSGHTKLLQGVREIYELTDAADAAGAQNTKAARDGKIVVIGRGLDQESWQLSLTTSIKS